MNRRQFLQGLGVLGLGVTAYGLHQYWPRPGMMNACLAGIPEGGPEQAIIAAAWEGIDPAQVWDCHVHLVGTGDSDSGIWFNPNMDSYMHPILKVQKLFYINGGCTDPDRVDESYLKRLVEISMGMPIGFKSMVFAFDRFHTEDGKPDNAKSIFYIPNEYAAAVAKANHGIFEWVASIHPYRPDAIEVLQKAHAEGARAIKWLPSGMGLDPLSPKCGRFYKAFVDLNMPIISHTGRESAVQGGTQAHGNPLRMRKALDAGVRVVLAHCASDGYDEDMDKGNAMVKSFDLFTRLMDTNDYKGLVFREISALTLINHAWAIKPILERSDWHDRLINGSDYPLPGIMPLISPSLLAADGLLDEEVVPVLEHLRSHNPLMFDFVLKRHLRHEANRFVAQTFQTRAFFTGASA
jgi:predicted TIM-barrel fold metal-dependent hydrolase